ncbi:unnamed protein product [Linum trigynum]|uniref:C2H2-type domain-containing protein n=1 Tax=Linum trigynum TaxID=586398 RepID=A0AAV2F4K0_9ROSI
MLARGTTNLDFSFSHRPRSASPVALPETTTAEEKLLLSHKCVVREKAFSSYQALGVHKANHRKSLSGAKIEAAAQSTSSTTSTSTVVAVATLGSDTPSNSYGHRLDH